MTTPNGDTTPAPRTLAIVRALNEQGTVGAVVADVRDHIPGCVVVVVDDGSTDATAARARAAGARVVSLPFNLGMGGAAQTGYRIARDEGFDAAVQVDGDGQHPGSEAARVLDALRGGGHDLVVGSRFLEGCGHLSTPARRVGIRVASHLLSAVMGRRVTDATSGLRAVGPRGIALFARSYPCDYVEVEALILAARQGLRVAEVPVTMRARRDGRSTIRPAQALVYGARVAVGAASLAATRRVAADPG